MMNSHFDDYLKQQNEQWCWHIPEQFNITEQCVTQHVINGDGEKIAFIVEDSQLGIRQLSYQSLEIQSIQFSNLLNQHSIQKGDRVLIRLPNAVEYPISFFGCIRHGAIAVPTSTLLATSEVAYLAKDSSAKVLVAHKNMWPEIQPILNQQTQLKAVFLVGKGDMPKNTTQSEIELVDFNQTLSQMSTSTNDCTSKSDDPAYLVYTSGTTGYPKGVLHAHRSLIGRLPASRYWFDFQPGDRIMHSGKFNWTYVLGSALMDPLFHGHTVIVHEGPNDAKTWLELIKKHECTIFIGVPTIYRQIIQKTSFSAHDIPSLRHCMSAGEHLSDEMLLAWRERFHLDVYEAIGMSEFSYYISQHKHKAIKPGSAGFPQPGHNLQLLNANNQPVTCNEEGMIAIPENDPGLFLKYWNLPEETQSARHNGYFYTGDYARIDENGYIWFLGRKDDIINTFGYRVSPHEIERVIKTYPGVADCVALGEEVEKNKVLVSICVILSDDIETIDTTTISNQLISFGQANLAKYKAPKLVYFFTEFPRTKNGKVLRKKLIQELTKKAKVSTVKGETE
ncbi:acyl-CoA synthetase [Aliikangiella sp. IMCC44359]|uniref:acyl-CoA synthetase n=1 Tax=Aliikangiella sp. IMCC44359 TaxID=3459125 RepID=UPI00403B027D